MMIAVDFAASTELAVHDLFRSIVDLPDLRRISNASARFDIGDMVDHGSTF